MTGPAELFAQPAQVSGRFDGRGRVGFDLDRDDAVETECDDEADLALSVLVAEMV